MDPKFYNQSLHERCKRKLEVYNIIYININIYILMNEIEFFFTQNGKRDKLSQHLKSLMHLNFQKTKYKNQKCFFFSVFCCNEDDNLMMMMMMVMTTMTTRTKEGGITICNSRPAFVLGTTTVAIIILEVPAPIHTRRSSTSS